MEIVLKIQDPAFKRKLASVKRKLFEILNNRAIEKEYVRGLWRIVYTGKDEELASLDPCLKGKNGWVLQNRLLWATDMGANDIIVEVAAASNCTAYMVSMVINDLHNAYLQQFIHSPSVTENEI